MAYALVIDDERIQRNLIGTVLDDYLDLFPIYAQNGQDAFKILNDPKAKDICLITLDLAMPVMDGIETLNLIQKRHSSIPVIVVTGTQDIEHAAEAIKSGAVDFFSKPVKKERILVSAQNALKIGLLKNEVTRLKQQSKGIMKFDDLIGSQGGLKPFIHIAGKAAGSNVPVLITGETGVGKEVFARAIHGESAYKDKPFIAVNCGAIPENLVESTLFGHEKGAFTGAIQKSLGKFREAEGGTIFLDEVGELSPDTQVKLLRVLQEHEIEPVGAGKSVFINTRVISATNRDLQRDILENTFREDLYFRLNVLPLSLPPLRERRSDIFALIDFFINSYCLKNKVPVKQVSTQAIEKLQTHDWPGNVRELENTINRSLILCDGNILEEEDISFFSNTASQSPFTSQHDSENLFIPTLRDDGSLHTLEQIENMFFDFALSQCANNITKTAKAIGIAKSTLYRKINNRI